MSGLIIQKRGDGFAHAGKGVKHDFAVSACTVDVEHDLTRFSQIAELFYLLQT